MYITHENFMQELNQSVNEMLMIVKELEKYDQDTPENHLEHEIIFDRFNTAMEHLPEIIQFIANNQPDPAIAGLKLKQALTLLTEILKEKTRILNNTPRIIREANEDIGYN